MDKRPGGGKGFRNTFDLSPTSGGVTIGPETGCGDFLENFYGEFERFVTGDHIEGRDPVEIQTTNHYILVEATNSDDNPDHWQGQTYLLSGKRTYCVSYKHLKFWRCQDGTMGSEGQLQGFGTNSRGYDLAK